MTITSSPASSASARGRWAVVPLIAQARRQEARRVVEVNATLRQQPSDDLGKAQPLGDSLPRSCVAIAQAPATAAHRPLDPQYHPGNGLGASRAVIHMRV